jgi:catechol-2,3-dioxygenase
LEAKRQELLEKGLAVTDIVDHEWARSIYFKDPNGISLEYCCLTRDVGTQDDVTMQVRVERSVQSMRQRWERLSAASHGAAAGTAG